MTQLSQSTPPPSQLTASSFTLHHAWLLIGTQVRFGPGSIRPAWCDGSVSSAFSERSGQKRMAWRPGKACKSGCKHFANSGYYRVDVSTFITPNVASAFGSFPRRWSATATHLPTTSHQPRARTNAQTGGTSQLGTGRNNSGHQNPASVACHERC